MTHLQGNPRWNSDQFAEYLLAVSAQRSTPLNEARRARILAALLAEAARLRTTRGWPAWIRRMANRAGVSRK